MRAARAGNNSGRKQPQAGKSSEPIASMRPISASRSANVSVVAPEKTRRQKLGRRPDGWKPIMRKVPYP